MSVEWVRPFRNRFIGLGLPSRFRGLIERFSRTRYVPADEIRALMRKYARRTGYDVARIEQHAFPWSFPFYWLEPGWLHGQNVRAEIAQGCDIPIEPPLCRCPICDAPLWKRADWRGICPSRNCRAVWMWDTYRRGRWQSVPIEVARSGLRGTYAIALYLEHMANGTTDHDAEFAKRFVGRHRRPARRKARGEGGERDREPVQVDAAFGGDRDAGACGTRGRPFAPGRHTGPDGIEGAATARAAGAVA